MVRNEFIVFFYFQFSISFFAFKISILIQIFTTGRKSISFQITVVLEIFEGFASKTETATF